jgi:WD40 repeat protein
MSFPDEIWFNVFIFSVSDDLSSIGTLGLVCKRFHGIVQDHRLWYAGFMARYPHWCKGVQYDSAAQRDWRAVLIRDFRFRSKWTSAYFDAFDGDDPNTPSFMEEIVSVNTREAVNGNGGLRLSSFHILDLSDKGGLSGIFSCGAYVNGEVDKYHAFIWHVPGWKMACKLPLPPQLEGHGRRNELVDVNWKHKYLATLVTTGNTLAGARLYRIGSFHEEPTLIDQIDIPEPFYFNSRQVLVVPDEQDPMVVETLLFGVDMWYTGTLIRIRHYLDGRDKRDQVTQVTYGSSIININHDPRWPDYVVTAHRDNMLCVWDMWTGKELQRFTGHSSVPWSARIQPAVREIAFGQVDAKYDISNLSLRIVSVSEDSMERKSEFCVWEIAPEQGPLAPTKELLRFTVPDMLIGFTLHTSLAICLTYNSTILVVDLENGNIIRNMQHGLGNTGRSILMIGEQVVLHGEDGVYGVNYSPQDIAQPFDKLSV